MSYIPIHIDCTDRDKGSYPIHLDDGSGEFHLDSCDSHEGCTAAENIKFCPYCGEQLKAPDEKR